MLGGSSGRRWRFDFIASSMLYCIHILVLIFPVSNGNLTGNAFAFYRVNLISAPVHLIEFETVLRK